MGKTPGNYTPGLVLAAVQPARGTFGPFLRLSLAPEFRPTSKIGGITLCLGSARPARSSLQVVIEPQKWGADFEAMGWMGASFPGVDL